MHLRPVSLVIAVVALAAVLASCGGGGASGGTPGAPENNGTPGNAHGDPVAYQHFKDAATRFAALPAYAVSYNAKVDNPGGASFSATVDFTHKGSTTRMEFDGTVNGAATRFTMLKDDKSLTVCQSQTATCARSTDASAQNPLASLDPIGILNTVTGDASVSVQPASSQTFAGVAGSCYAVTQKAQHSTFCVDPATGILLLASGQSTGSGSQPFTETIAARSISTVVGAVDTSTPYPIAG
jgi:hypothetical protein